MQTTLDFGERFHLNLLNSECEEELQSSLIWYLKGWTWNCSLSTLRWILILGQRLLLIQDSLIKLDARVFKIWLIWLTLLIEILCAN